MASEKRRNSRNPGRSGKSGNRRVGFEPSPEPYLAELRRRATARLRALAIALEAARGEYEAAAAECARLHAPGGNAGEEPSPQVGIYEAPEAVVPDAEDSEIESLAARAEELEERLRQAKEAWAVEESARREAEQRARELEGRLNAAEGRLADEEGRASALVERARELEARLEEARNQPADGGQEALEAVRGRVASLEADLRSTRAVNSGLREEMTELLGFLDELNSILSAAAR